MGFRGIFRKEDVHLDIPHDLTYNYPEKMYAQFGFEKGTANGEDPDAEEV